MADRVLTWHLPGSVADHAGSDVDAAFVADRNYSALALTTRLKTAVSASVDEVKVGSDLLILDINDDGVSIFSLLPTISDTLTDHDDTEAFVGDVIRKGSVLTLDVDQAGPGARDLTVSLELEAED